MEIVYLADHTEFIPALAAWFDDERGYLNPNSTIKDIEDSLHHHLHRDELPLALVAFSGTELLGSASLRSFDLKTRKDLSPWLASVYVPLEHRRKGIGQKLVQAAEETASRMGIATLYLYTLREQFYARLGWSTLERTEYRQEQVVIMHKHFAAPESNDKQ